VGGAQLFVARPGVIAYHVNGFAPDGDAPHLAAERTAALELSLFELAIAARCERIDLGYTRAVLNDGLFEHKRRLGCTFAPATGGPAFRVLVREGRRAAVFTRFPLLTGAPDSWEAVLGFDDAAPRLRGRSWRAGLRSYRALHLRRTVLWTNACALRCNEPDGEAGFLAALGEVLDQDVGTEVRVEGGARCRACLDGAGASGAQGGAASRYNPAPMTAPKITVYTRAHCPYCVRAKRLLDRKGFSYEEIDVEGDDALRGWLAERTGQLTVPQIFAGERSLGGFSDLDALDRAGRLEPILRGEG
jgi:glutaredoxin 3